MTSTGSRATSRRICTASPIPCSSSRSWFDAQDFRGPFRMYRSIEEKNAANRSTMVVGPWLHGGWARMDGDTLGQYRLRRKDRRVLPPQRRTAVLQLLPQGRGRLALPEVLAFHTGANRWESLEGWPPRGSEVRKLYLHGNGRLSFSAPETRRRPSTST